MSLQTQQQPQQPSGEAVQAIQQGIPSLPSPLLFSLANSVASSRNPLAATTTSTNQAGPSGTVSTPSDGQQRVQASSSQASRQSTSSPNFPAQAPPRAPATTTSQVPPASAAFRANPAQSPVVPSTSAPSPTPSGTTQGPSALQPPTVASASSETTQNASLARPSSASAVPVPHTSPQLQMTASVAQLKRSARHAEGYLYYSDTEPFPAGMKEEWEGKKGLKARILKKTRKINTDGTPLACDLLMASDADDPGSVRPYVVIRCVSEDIREKIRQSLLPRLRRNVVDTSRYVLKILIDTRFGELADPWPDSLSVQPAAPRLSIRRIITEPRRIITEPRSRIITEPRSSDVRIITEPRPSNVRILSEIHLAEVRFTVTSSEKAPKTLSGCGITRDRSPSLCDATFGGVISIDGKLVGLTAGHLFASLFPTLAEPPQDDEDDGWTTSSSDEAGAPVQAVATIGPPDDLDPFASQSSEDAGSRPYDEDKVSSANLLVSPAPRYRFSKGIVVAGGLAGRYFRTAAFSGGPSQLTYPSRGWGDWALLDISATGNILPNTYTGDGEDELAIDDFEMEQDLFPGPVSIICAESGVLQGHLSDVTASITLRGHQYDVRRIGLSQGLVHSDSGGWVVRGRRLCGIIIAGGGLLPWAYMLPIGRIFKEIKALLGAQDVKVAAQEAIPRTSVKASVGNKSPVATGEVKPFAGRAGKSPRSADEAYQDFLARKYSARWRAKTLRSRGLRLPVDNSITPASRGITGQTLVIETEKPNSEDATELEFSFKHFLQRIFGEDITSIYPMFSEEPLWHLLRTELIPSHLISVQSALRLAGHKRRRMPLHEQVAIGRSIVITEDPNMHLVWYRSRMFIKPLPLYVLDGPMWSEIARSAGLRAGTSNFLRSYTDLVRYPSDWKIAKEIGLLPSELSWVGWKDLCLQILRSRQISSWTTADSLIFYEINLDTLCEAEYQNILLYSRSNAVPLPIPGLRPGYYGLCRQRLQAPSENTISGFWAFVGSGVLALLALLTGLSGDVLSKNGAFQQAAYGFVVFCLSLLAVVIASWFLRFVTLGSIRLQLALRLKGKAQTKPYTDV